MASETQQLSKNSVTLTVTLIEDFQHKNLSELKNLTTTMGTTINLCRKIGLKGLKFDPVPLLAFRDQILHITQMLKFCIRSIPGTTFLLIMKVATHDVRESLNERYVAPSTLRRRQGFHQFTPVLETKIGTKRVSESLTLQMISDPY